MAKQPPGAGSATGGARALRPLCFLGAALLVLVATPLSLVQEPPPDPLRTPEALSPAWWLRPIELHGADRLPWLDADLLDLAAVEEEGRAHVIAVGRRGAIIASSDGGRTWRQEFLRRPKAPAPPVVPAAGEKVAPAPNAPAVGRGAREAGSEAAPARDAEKKPAKLGSPRPTKASLLLDLLVPRAHAIEALPEPAAAAARAQRPPAAAPSPSYPAQQGRPALEVDLEGAPATDDVLDLMVSRWPNAVTAMTASGRYLRREPHWVPLLGSLDEAAGSGGRPVEGTVVPYPAAVEREPRGARMSRVRGTRSGTLAGIADRRVFRKLDGEWRAAGTPGEVALRGVFFLDAAHGWAVGDDGTLFRTVDGGAKWNESAVRAPVPLNAVAFLPGTRRGWIAGDRGYVAESIDGGATFASRTRPYEAGVEEAHTPVRLPPPWYGLTWLVALGLVFVGRSIPPAREGTTELAVAPTFASDRPLEPGDPDVLNLSALAAGLSRFLRNEATRPPLTIAVTGVWGTGKSSLMNLLRGDLRTFGFEPVWFNAWHHQNEEHLLASMLQSIRIQAIPPFWRVEGLLFRIHLLLIRGRKHALLLLALFAALGLLLAYETAGGHTHDLTKVWAALRAAIEFVVGGDDVELKPFEGFMLAEIGAVAMLVVSVVRGLRAFGLNPASLLASAAGSIKMGDLAAQTSFRERFRSEYREVTQALGARTLIIFIDDLDRCRPEQVMEVLESINFLVTSGDCYVVIGMDRSRVEPCVALSFKEVAAEMSGHDHQASRRDYAIQYLDKLINIEVPVPVLNKDDAERVLDAAPAPAAFPAIGRRWRSGLREAFSLAGPVLRFWPLAVAALVLMAGYAGGQRLWHESAGAAVAPPAVAAGGKGEVARSKDQGTASGGGSVAGPDAPRPPAAPAGRVQTGKFQAPGGGSFPVSVFLMALLLIWVGFLVVQIARMRPEVVVRDSVLFKEALRAWGPLIFKSASTPRALKRFQNRVRFLSMRQRPSRDERSWPRRALDRLRGRPAPVASSDELIIPDDVLVALAALHQSHPALLEAANPGPELEALLPSASMAAELLAHRAEFLRRARGIRV
jgi:hypothetical protein